MPLPPVSPGPRVRVVPVIATALAYFLLGKLAFAASVTHDIVTLVVFGSEGVALAAMLRWGPQAALGIFLGQGLLALSTGLSWVPALAISLINALEGLLALRFFRWVDLDPDLDHLRDILLLFLGSALVLQLFSATLGVGTLWALGRIPSTDLHLSFWSWWMGNVLGQCLFAPTFLLLSKPIRTWAPAPLLAALGTGLLGLTTFEYLGSLGKPAFALSLAFYFAVLAVTALRFGLAGGILSSFTLSLLAIIATHRGQGPFTSSWMELNLFLAGSNLTTMALGALFAERLRLETQLRTQNEALEAANHQLSKALMEVKTLEGMLPICSYCNQIRDDHGYWKDLEVFLARRSGLHFSHSICPRCEKRFFAGDQGDHAP